MCDELIGTAQNFQRSPVCSLVRVRRWSASLVAARVGQAAFEPLYRRYLALVYWYCSRRLGSKETGKDATAQYSSYQVLINVDLHVRGDLGKANEY